MSSAQQYAIVQCQVCGKWFILRCKAGKRQGVMLEDLAAWETSLHNECSFTHHKGRRRWKFATGTTR